MIVARFYEPRTRWWGGKRADIELVEREIVRGGQGLMVEHELWRGTWSPPPFWEYHEVKIWPPLKAASQSEGV